MPTHNIPTQATPEESVKFLKEMIELLLAGKEGRIIVGHKEYHMSTFPRARARFYLLLKQELKHQKARAKTQRIGDLKE